MQSNFTSRIFSILSHLLLVMLFLTVSENIVNAQDFPEPYCEVIGLRYPEPITMVNIADLENRTSPHSNVIHADYTQHTAHLTVGQNYLITIEGNTEGDYENEVIVWIDWNQDGEFDESTETYRIGTFKNSTGEDGKHIIGNISVPEEAKIGTTRLRIIKALSGKYSPESCVSSSPYGQAVDYSISVKDVECVPPVELKAVHTIANLIDITWHAPKENDQILGYEYAITSSNQPPSSGTFTTDTILRDIEIQENDLYLHFRTHCETESTSEWAVWYYHVDIDQDISDRTGTVDSFATIPANPQYTYSYSQQIIYAEELLEMLKQNENLLDGISFLANAKHSSSWTIWLAHTDKNTFEDLEDWENPAELTQVFHSNPSFKEDKWTRIRFRNAFEWNREDNLIIAVRQNVVNRDPNIDIGYAVWADDSLVEGENRTLITYRNDRNYDVSHLPPANHLRKLSNAFYLFYTENNLCESPKNMRAEDLAVGKVRISWEPPAEIMPIEYAYYFNKTGTKPDPDTEPLGTNEAWNTSHILNDLDVGTEYYFWIKSHCEENKMSDWAGPLKFTPGCVIESVPFYEGFEGVQMQDEELEACWIRQQVSGNAVWRINKTDQDMLPRTGNKNIYLKAGSAEWMYQPILLEAGKEYMFSAYARQDTTFGAVLTLAYGDKPNAGSMVEIARENIKNGDYQMVTGRINPMETGVYYIGLKGETSLVPTHLLVDDISVVPGTSCHRPIELSAYVHDYNSVEVTWSAPQAGSLPESYEYYYNTSSTMPDETTNPMGSVDSELPSVEITGLEYNQDYYFWVRSHCDNNESGLWSERLLFRTYCTSLKAPFTEDFESGEVGNSIKGTLTCWRQEYTSEHIDWKYNSFKNENNLIPHSGEKVAEFKNPGIVTRGSSMLITPPIDMTGLAVPMLEFYFSNKYKIYSDELRVYYKKDIDDEDWVLIDGAEYLVGYDTWQKVNLLLPEAQNTESYVIAFEATTELARGVILDDISVIEKYDCPTPIFISTEIIDDQSITFTWEAPYHLLVNGYEWELHKYMGPEKVLVQAGFVDEDSSTLTLSNLQHDLIYEFQIRSLCEDSMVSEWSEPLWVSIKYCKPATLEDNLYINSFTTSKGLINIDNRDSGYSIDGFGDYYETDSIFQRVRDSVKFEMELEGENIDVKIWVDWNKDGTFDDDELVHNDSLTNGTHTGSFVIPHTALKGKTRMRVLASHFDKPRKQEPCMQNLFGAEYEDYGFIVSSLSCDAPHNLSVDVLNHNQARFNWSAPIDEDVKTYEYYYREGDPAYPDESGISTQDTSIILEDLEGGYNYFAWVRTICESGEYSFWEGPIKFRTTSVSTLDLAFANVSFYPNPAHDRLSLKADFSIKAIKIHNLYGEMLIFNQINEEKYTVDVSSLTAGIYFMKIYIEDSEMTVKFIIQ